VQSVEGGGAAFEVDLPLASEPIGLPREATG
jgi:hypothetical protein